MLVASCGQEPTSNKKEAQVENKPAEQKKLEAPVSKPKPTNPRFGIYKEVELNSDLSHLSANQKKMIALLIDASTIMDELFWKQAYGDKQALLDSISDKATRRFADINYGPWDRLDGDKPFIKSFGEKPLGATFYPKDMTKEELSASKLAEEKGLYSIIKRNADGALYSVPYHQEFKEELTKAASLLRDASNLADNSEFKNYLKLRADALLTDDFQKSDFAWMDMKTNPIDVVIGPIETYEDLLLGYRTAYESYVLIKDQSWSEKLAKYAAFLPELQKGLPVPQQYKQETPGTDSDLNAYDVVYYAGHSNAGSKTIAINLPNDEQVQLAKGTRRLQLKNAMKAKFDHILIPIAGELIAEDQRQFITFDAFFANTMFHEVAHGLGIKNTLDGKGTVRNSLKETASALEEGKADILGLYMVSKLFESGDIDEGKLMDNYVTFLAGIFRSVRFGASSAHGKANMVRFNFFKKLGAFSRNEKTGLYRVNFDAMTVAMNELSRHILTLQGDGNYQGAVELLNESGVIGSQLAKDLGRLEEANIPVDIVFKQGKSVLGVGE
ncbi:Zn-dependent hydrolase [Aliikangiella coralliicola]|uniref:Zn-dependent hydrolase n=2 Tax=Aliikangiella coralliicola TaxID=2592383 RepID=A0A545U0M9_9GAMM|nr:Zn-dependent hydrolase [Aliikangiella coralliicola]